jgi:hypothetical protein
MSRKLVVAALTAACMFGFGACAAVHAESAVKSSKKTSEKLKGRAQGQSAKPTPSSNSGSSAGGQADSEYGQSGPKGR